MDIDIDEVIRSDYQCPLCKNPFKKHRSVMGVYAHIREAHGPRDSERFARARANHLDRAPDKTELTAQLATARTTIRELRAQLRLTGREADAQLAATQTAAQATIRDLQAQLASTGQERDAAVAFARQFKAEANAARAQTSAADAARLRAYVAFHEYVQARKRRRSDENAP